MIANAFVDVHHCSCKLVNRYFVKVVLCKVRGLGISQNIQLIFQQMLKPSINNLIFQMVNTFSKHRYWPWIKTWLIRFPSPCRVNWLRYNFLKEINCWLFVLSLPMFIFFLKMIYSKNDERKGCSRGPRKQNFLCCPTMMGKPLDKFLKTIPVDFHILVIASLKLFWT